MFSDSNQPTDNPEIRMNYGGSSLAHKKHIEMSITTFSSTSASCDNALDSQVCSSLLLSIAADLAKLDVS